MWRVTSSIFESSRSISHIAQKEITEITSGSLSAVPNYPTRFQHCLLRVYPLHRLHAVSTVKDYDLLLKAQLLLFEFRHARILGMLWTSNVHPTGYTAILQSRSGCGNSVICSFFVVVIYKPPSSSCHFWGKQPTEVQLCCSTPASLFFISNLRLFIRSSHSYCAIM